MRKAKKIDIGNVKEMITEIIPVIDALPIGPGCKVMAIQRLRDSIDWIARGVKEA